MADTLVQPHHRNRAELNAALPHILDAPKDSGTLDAIVIRPDHGLRKVVTGTGVSAEGGLPGDHWAKGCWMTTDEGLPHPDVQVCIMMSRVIGAIAGPRENWPPAGDNLFIDMNLTPENVPPGTRLAIGSAVLEVTAVPHLGCQKFIDRYGRDACVFVNTGPGKAYSLRGIYARVIADGEIHVSDEVSLTRIGSS